MAVASLASCEASQAGRERIEATPPAAGPASTSSRIDNNSGTSVTNDQVPINQRFRSLDEYLAHLEKMEKPVGGPWYAEVSPGVFQLQTGNLHLDVPNNEQRTFTREELERKFGFAK